MNQGISLQGEAKEEREQWGSRTMFLLAAIGAAIGLGNVWRFPYLVYRHGGGAFLVPYILSLLFLGMPILLLELVLGQHTQRGALEAMQKLHRRAWGLGLASALGAFVVVIYYNILMAWAFIYLVASFNSTLPWGQGLDDAQAYFKHVTGQSDGLQNFGTFQWRPLLGLVAAWTVVYACICKGIKSVGPASLVTAPLPFLLLLILLIRGLTLSGMDKGLQYYLTPDPVALVNPKVWVSAASQILFSLSILAGVMIAYGSFCGPKSNMNTNQLIISLTNSGTSILAGFVVFSTLGHFAQETNTGVDNVTEGGVELAFVVFPAALVELPAAPFFSVLFFLMLISLGIDSAFSLVEALCTIIYDRSEWCNNHKPATSGAVCFVGFLLGTPMTEQGGRYLLDILDHYMSNYVLIAIAFLEVVLVGWVYGADRLANEVLARSGYAPPKIWVWVIRYVDPVVLAVLFFYNLIDEFITFYGDYPWWGILIGWLTTLAIFGVILYGALRPMDVDGSGLAASGAGGATIQMENFAGLNIFKRRSPLEPQRLEKDWRQEDGKFEAVDI